MPLKLAKRNGYWHITGSHKGVRIRRSTHTAHKRQAEEELARTLEHINSGGQRRAVGFAEAAEAYLAHGSERYLLGPLDAFQDIPVKDIDQPMLDQAARRAYPNAAESTINRQFYTPAIAVLNFAARQNWCPARIWQRPSAPQGRLDWRSPEEMEAFILAAPWPVARNVIIYLGSMMRVSEGVALTRDDTSEDGVELSLWTTKANYPRKVEVLTRAAPLISDRDDGPVIRTSDGKAYHAYDAVNLSIRRVCEKHGLPHFSAHTLRHTGATWRYALDPDLPRLMAYGGWRTPAMAMRYTHVASRNLPDQLRAYGWDVFKQA